MNMETLTTKFALAILDLVDESSPEDKLALFKMVHEHSDRFFLSTELKDIILNKLKEGK